MESLLDTQVKTLLMCLYSVDMHFFMKKRVTNLFNFIFQEKYFREQQQELNTWHQDFWEKQNEKFSKVRCQMTGLGNIQKSCKFT